MTRLALVCGLPFLVACSIFGGDDDGSGASPAGSDGETDAGSRAHGRDSGSASSSATDGGRRGDAGAATSSCDALSYCCTELDGSSQSSCEGVAASGDSLSCDGALASYRKQGFCAPGGGTGGGADGGTGGGTGGIDAGPGTGSGTVTTCAELTACCATLSDSSSCTIIASIYDDATCASYALSLGCD
ncbi:MAG: hypothetical protein ABI551_15000 [Polyangiaceae bacterium]